MAGIDPIDRSLGTSAIGQQAYYASRISAAYAAAANPAQPNAPVEPVSPVRRVAPDAAVRVPVSVQERRLPTEDDLNNAADNLARMRVRYPDETDNTVAQALSQFGLDY